MGHHGLLPAAPLGASSRVGHAAGYREPDEGKAGVLFPVAQGRESCGVTPGRPPSCPHVRGSLLAWTATLCLCQVLNHKMALLGAGSDAVSQRRLGDKGCQWEQGFCGLPELAAPT